MLVLNVERDDSTHRGMTRKQIRQRFLLPVIHHEHDLGPVEHPLVDLDHRLRARPR